MIEKHQSGGRKRTAGIYSIFTDKIEIRNYKDNKMRIRAFFPLIFILILLNSIQLTAEDKKPPEKTDQEDKKTVVWSSEDLYMRAYSVDTIEEGIIEAIGYAEIIYQGQHLQADRIKYNRKTGVIEAEGNVSFETEDASIACKRMEGYKDGTGKFENALIYTGDYIIRGELFIKEKDGTYTLEDAEITPCTQINPCWSLVISSGSLKIDDYLFLKSIFFRIKGIPILYIPAFYLPLDKETGRTTGFLIPSIGSSNIYGTSINEGFFWAISDSFDTTLYANYYSEKGLGMGLETRYLLDRRNGGIIDFFYLKEKDTDNVRWNLNANHRQDLLGWKFSLSSRLTSDITYNQDYNDNITDISSRSSSYFKGRLSNNLGPLSINIDGNYQETVLSGNKLNVRAYLPSADISLRPVKLFSTPVYISIDGNISNLYRETSTYELEYQRYDINPIIKATFAGIPWLKISSTFQYRYTYYTDSLTANLKDYTGEPFSRSYYNVNMKLLGPTFYKVYYSPEFGYADKFKHVIEPVFEYNYISEPEDITKIIRFDSVDYVSPVNELRIGLANRLIAHRREGGDRFKTLEIFSWNLRQYISLDSTLKTSYGSQYNRFLEEGVITLSPLVSDIKFAPLDNLSFSNRLEYNYDYKQLASMNFMLTWRSENFFTDIKWMKTFQLEATRIPSDQLTANGGFSIFDRTFDISYVISYDFENEKLWRGNIGLKYNHQCFSVSLAYNHFEIGKRIEDKFSFNIELTGISGMLSGPLQ